MTDERSTEAHLPLERATGSRGGPPVPNGHPVPGWVRLSAALGLVGVAFYVAAWALAGAWWSGYDPMEQAISELFARGAPTPGRTLVIASLVASGLGLLLFGAAMHRGLPGRGRAGPIAALYAGVMTVLVTVAPCTAGCPGAGSSLTDTAHTVIAGSGYVALVAAPLLTAPRLRPHAPRLATWSVVLGLIAAIGFVVRFLGVLDVYAGFQQRLFNTVADAWFVLVAMWLIGAGRDAAPARRRRSQP